MANLGFEQEGADGPEAFKILRAPDDGAGTLVIVQNHGPDDFFTGGQQERLGELMAGWRTAHDKRDALPAAEEAELEELIEAEARAAGERAAAVLAGLAK